MKVKYKVSNGEIICMGSIRDLAAGPGEAVENYFGSVIVRDIKAFKFIGGEFIEKTEAEKYVYLYASRRAAEYPPVEDQLDALWHAMDRSEIPRVPGFYDLIKAVKDRYPKP